MAKVKGKAEMVRAELEKMKKQMKMVNDRVDDLIGQVDTGWISLSDILKKTCVSNMTVESLARLYHDACRELVNNHPQNLITKTQQPYIEWDNLTDDQKEGRRVVARYLLDELVVVSKVSIVTVLQDIVKRYDEMIKRQEIQTSKQMETISLLKDIEKAMDDYDKSKKGK